MIRFTTRLGSFDIELFPEDAPITTENFLGYVRSGFFEGTTFHRVIPGFVVQGGGLTADMSKKETEAPIKNEADNGLKNQRGTLSMARTQNPHSATSQFFINLRDNVPLDRSSRDAGYAVFGRVAQGMDVIDAMAEEQTGPSGMHDDVPVTPIVVTTVEELS